MADADDGSPSTITQMINEIGVRQLERRAPATIGQDHTADHPVKSQPIDIVRSDGGRQLRRRTRMIPNASLALMVGAGVRSRSTIALVALVVVGSGAFAASASATSAFPLKQPGDSGRYSGNALFGIALPKGDVPTANGDLYALGFDACTTYDNQGTSDGSYIQYQVPDCAPVQSPWIETKPLGSPNWSIYCSDSAPYSWVATGSDEGTQGGALQAWGTTKAAISGFYRTRNYGFGPDPPAKSEYAVINASTRTNYWGFD